ncbi:hypothetical protein Q6261_26370, partial [Klebsiella pneumoniae]|uniref:hypothetical protein n=1 Tax=Klebsiella pneumoniae TaxID=573 RepID=UPI002762A07C|nr:hypothetical protein [Klebsiella pneumoniae]
FMLVLLIVFMVLTGVNMVVVFVDWDVRGFGVGLLVFEDWVYFFVLFLLVILLFLDFVGFCDLFIVFF